jgi:(2Fe-2S) ferredoxin
LNGSLATLFVVSAYSLSARAFERLQSACGATVDGPVRLLRLEGTGPSLIEALDTLRQEGARDIRVQPLGVPFPKGLLNWLPGVLADWRTRGANADTTVFFGPEPAKSVDNVRPSLGKPGWNLPPDYDFHLLVCTGPRCAVHGASSFIDMLKTTLKEAGVFDRCLTTRTGCAFPCNKGPVLVLYPHGYWYRLPDGDATRRFVREVLVEGGTASDLRFHTAKTAFEPENMQTIQQETFS